MEHFTLSERALEILSEISQKHGQSLSECLEFIVLQYRTSDMKRNSARRRRAWEEYLASHPSADRDSFFAGHNAGWL